MSDDTTEYRPGQGPGPRALTEEEAARLLGAQRFGVLATLKRGGQPHLASMVYTWDPEERIIRFTSIADRIKVRHLLKDPRATFHVQGETVLSYAVAEGEAEVSEVTTRPGDAVGRELRSLFGITDPADEAEFFERMVRDRRLVIRLRVSHLYGTALDGPVAP
ncbi:TIGR03618 family F420-dependent PPOX class oxidoreductase [Actinoallomurus spadix]|uniref:TIGR03618 family F420-dependent PPOX class oxidoreductase n=1 Tax=Actinoallomurus spadix TaxID=79912 RepID=A0ABN0WSH9_9ACTN|nr:TIGR03618 family F420-dependent PPOX class oxidoreductase [Actinoallomurus spadix]MCO5990102.1 TIGR03618 family F420-dependent PPOX class oxidoreductase [Actinoallomurus spadix]